MKKIEQALTVGDTCKEALKLLTTDRAKSYGDPYDNFRKAKELLWHKTGENLAPSLLVQVLICLKEARQFNNHKPDNLIDIIGYNDILAYVSEREKGDLK